MLVIAASLVACGGGYSSGGSSYSPPPMQPQPVSGSVFATLGTMTTIGSTLDPTEHGGNPYGLTIAPVTAGLVTAGDLVVCNFNDGATNTQGLGTTVVGLHPVKGAAPYRIAQSSQLLGCSAVTALPDSSIVATASQANSTVLVSPTGAVSSPFSANPSAEPWGAITSAYHGTQLLFVSNAANGTVDRITMSGDTQTSFTEIAAGFSVNRGAPGSISAPAGLTYDASIDTLYVVDTNSNRVVALAGASAIGKDGVMVSGSSFTGASASSARVIASGAPLNGPISSALLANGNLVVGNTLDANGTNLLVEVSPSKGVVATKNVDTGAAGAIFGIVAVPATITVTTSNGYNGSTTMSVISNVIYFNDDNTNTVVAWSQ
ncbi:MAG: hypothetical protein JO142_09635 [Burkholderiales bacterium]|nr:hypothetical protein [Burkholderiales bacterium]